MDFFNNFTNESIATGIVVLILIISRIMSTKLVRKFAKSTHIIENRTNLVIKYFHLLINILVIIALIIIWGVRPKEIISGIASVATVIGVAGVVMIAQWSILSNITSGVLLFFSFPFKIGDVIQILDKDFPIIGEIEDIGAFHVTLKNKEGETIIYPNNLFFQKGISILPNHYDEKEFVD
ncbi:mechanosensitive ion channel domain-containing protein [Flavobacterium undicola]|uniref:mechanosensitive ion channel domain-containing protein n=1 Tax=Flavobacterium undicola TaxID=1932779 RepID=UPI00137822F5|nr:mechanosensitive ion channel domain-containing protein [Flavobacterium undicola]MBA0883099.1 mechanosensitive ion channel [Flavobacterium undicola]